MQSELELWGGAECTVNRVGDSFGDQLRESGHDERPSDLERFAGLGLRALRFPVLWERVAPDDPAVHHWGASDSSLARLYDLGLRPIAGLIHHGSGPRYTNLLADTFAPGLARHARAVAERYSWINEWTPVNEPVTTARFAMLYGHWHPHLRDERSFWLALLNQIDGTRLAMREIRRVNPAARLIQTDDLGRTYATGPVCDQAAFDNARRWMGWDLLCGRVTPRHNLWDRLCGFGLEDRLRTIADNPCPPDVIGVNHYLTSDRFLDHRWRRYPAGLRGRNSSESFVDTEAIRVLQPPPAGLAGALREAWSRYEIQLAVTEVHNGSTRDEQMRWMLDAWNVATALREDGIDIQAVTCWALLGSSGWNTLLTGDGQYEAGVFDVRGGEPRATAMVDLLANLHGRAGLHPVLEGVGWWRRSIRLQHPEVSRPALMREHLPTANWVTAPKRRPVLIIGRTGTLGGALAAACRHRNVFYVVTDRAELNLNDAQSITAALDRHRPWAVINAAGWVRVDEAELDSAGCRLANTEGAVLVATASAERGIPTASFSSDLVFDGQNTRPYVEDDAPAPLGAYGRSKAEAERVISTLDGSHLIVRTAAFFSPFDPHNFAMQAVAALARNTRFQAAVDQIVTPTYVPDLCNAVLDLMIDGANGIWHLSNQDAVSWWEFACKLAERGGLDLRAIEAVRGADLGWVATRPRYAALASKWGALLPPLDNAIDRFTSELRKKVRPANASMLAPKLAHSSDL